MTARVFEAVYRHGAFRLVGSHGRIRANTRARVLVCPQLPRARLQALRGSLSKKEADKALALIKGEFGRIEGEW